MVSKYIANIVANANWFNNSAILMVPIGTSVNGLLVLCYDTKMTVTYTAKVATVSFSGFLRLLLRWRGSVYKLLALDFLLFALAYFILSFIYRFALGPIGKKRFEMVALYCDNFNNLIPIAFVLGFYVSIVVSRWWDQFNTMPWPDRMALFITANVHGNDERGRLMRRTVMRYLCLSFVITLSSISSAVKKRFPTFEHMRDAGFMVTNELKILEDLKTPHNKYFIPLVWSTSLIARARKEGRIKDDFAVKTLIDEVNDYRGRLGTLFNYDWISIPLVYTQVVTIAVYTFFLSCLMGRQFLEETTHSQRGKGDIYVPVFTFLQFLFYMGWLKVAETLVNPFGEDDDDFDVNMIIDRNLQISYLVVDEMHSEHPELIRDAYWDTIDFELPYTAASEPFRMPEPFLGSAVDINVSPKQADFVPLSSIPEGNLMDNVHGIDMNNLSTTPTDVPHQRNYFQRLISRENTQSPRPKGIMNLIRRSTSRDSRNTNFTLSPRPQRTNRQVSMTSGGTTTPPGSPSINPDDIFNMSDLSDTEDTPGDRMQDSDSGRLLGSSDQRPRSKMSRSHRDEMSSSGESTLKAEPSNSQMNPDEVKIDERSVHSSRCTLRGSQDKLMTIKEATNEKQTPDEESTLTDILVGDKEAGNRWVPRSSSLGGTVDAKDEFEIQHASLGKSPAGHVHGSVTAPSGNVDV